MNPTDSAMQPSVVDQFLYLYRDLIMQAYPPLTTFSFGVFWFVTMYSFAMVLTVVIASEGKGADQLIRKVGTMAFFAVLILNFQAIAGVVMDTMITIGLGMGGGSLSVEDFVTPSRTLDVGIGLSGKIWAYGDTLCTNPYNCVVNSGTVLLLHIACISVLILFGLAACMVLVAQLVFHLHALWALATMGTLMDSRVSWIGEKGIGGVVANAIKLGVLSTLVSLADGAFELIDFQSGTLNAIFVVFVVFMAVFMIWQSGSLAAGVINGGPSIGGESLMAHAVSTIVTATGVGSLGKAAGNAIGSAGHGLRQQISGGSGRTSGGAAPALPAPGNNAFRGPGATMPHPARMLPPQGGSTFAGMSARPGQGP